MKEGLEWLVLIELTLVQTFPSGYVSSMERHEGKERHFCLLIRVKGGKQGQEGTIGIIMRRHEDVLRLE